MTALSWARGLRGRGSLAQMDLYTRGSLYFMLWSAVAAQMMFSLTREVRHSDAPVVLIVASCLLAVAQGVCGHMLLARGLDTYLSGIPVPRRLLAAGAALLVLDLVAVLALVSAAGIRTVPVAGVLLTVPAAPLTMAHVLMVRPGVSCLVHLAAVAVLCGAVALLGGGTPLVMSCLITQLCVVGWFAVTVRVSAWSLNVMWKLQQAKDVQARLAVAEERLRFGRDLHDVMGRNLAVIALKSELAVQLTRRGLPEAIDQMIEVQRIARESQQGVREVVRGYREADLGVELDGARGVLEAAGIQCVVVGPPDGLSATVQSALGWVVREAATNVLRHGDARRCAITVSSSASDATLTVENDGAGGVGVVPGDPPGSGLLGLRERLTGVGGNLLAGPAAGDCFRLTAEIPLAAARRSGGEAMA